MAEIKYERIVALSAVDASINQTSSAIDCKNFIQMTIQNTSTSTAAGTVKVQGSMDLPQTGAPTNWVDIPSQSVAVTAASQTTITSSIPNFMWVRVVYTATSGAGALTTTMKLTGW